LSNLKLRVPLLACPAVFARRLPDDSVTAGLSNSAKRISREQRCWASQQWHPWERDNQFQNTFLGLRPPSLRQLGLPALFLCPVLLGKGSRLDGLSRGFRGRRLDTEDFVIGLMIVGGVLLSMWVLARFLSYQERRRASARPLRLFCSLCKAHGLRWSEWWLLWKVARCQRLRDPARVFLEPERLDPANLNTALRRRQAKLEALRGRIFGGLLETDWRPPAPPTPPAEDPLPASTDRLCSPLFSTRCAHPLDTPISLPGTQSAGDSPAVGST